MKVSTILEKIEENQLFVPAFQREYVWRRDDAKLLIDSLIKEYPVGTMLTWETSNPPELKGRYQYNEKQGAVKLLLDGQQRITTLYMLMNGEFPPYYSAEEISEDTRGLYVNVETLELLYYSKVRMEKNPAWQNITDVFKGKIGAFDLQLKFSEIGRILVMDDLKKLNYNINSITRIRDREFPEQTIPVRASVREAIDIFYKVNASGVSLTEAELALAQISGYWPQAREKIKAKLFSLEKEGFVLKLDFIVYVLLGCMYHVGSDMKKLHDLENNQKVRITWERLENQVLDYVINILKTSAFVDHTDEINSIYALVPIIVYCYDKNGDHLTDLEIRKLVKWFFYSQIRMRYTSQLPQKLDRDLRIISEAKHPFDSLLQVIAEESRLEITPSEFVGRAVQHPLFSMMRWYLKSRQAVCLTTGLSLRKNMGSKYQLERDHIFPYSKLREVGYGEGNRVKYSLAQEFTNRALLTMVANRTKSSTNADEYLAEICDKFPKSLELQCIPTNRELWKIENYELFLEERRNILAKQLNEFLEKITQTEHEIAPVSLSEIILRGESDSLEFKGSLRWDLMNSGVNKNLEDVVIKTIAAFANAKGGSLLIGVSDNGDILGLNHDYQSLSEGDRDKFELHLRNLLNRNIGIGFTSSKVNIKFHDLEGQDVCEVVVSPANDAVIINTKDKSGAEVQKLYVRSGNLSQEIPLVEIGAYFKGRFYT